MATIGESAEQDKITRMRKVLIFGRKNERRALNNKPNRLTVSPLERPLMDHYTTPLGNIKREIEEELSGGLQTLFAGIDEDRGKVSVEEKGGSVSRNFSINPGGRAGPAVAQGRA